jgi:hypothetical protein
MRGLVSIFKFNYCGMMQWFQAISLKLRMLELKGSKVRRKWRGRKLSAPPEMGNHRADRNLRVEAPGRAYWTSKKAEVLDIAAADDAKDRAAGWIEVQLKREEEKREEGGVIDLSRQNMVRGRAERVNSDAGLLWG